jgi:hypothetical protein
VSVPRLTLRVSRTVSRILNGFKHAVKHAVKETRERLNRFDPFFEIPNNNAVVDLIITFVSHLETPSCNLQEPYHVNHDIHSSLH